MVPNLKLYVGPMFSGKSTSLLQQVERYKFAKKSVVCFKPKMDNRYTDEGFIVTHSGIQVPCVLVNNGKEIINYFNDKNLPDAIAVDEAFMIDEIANACLNFFYDKRIDVLVSTLDLSSSLSPFEEVCTLLGHATKVKKCKAVCTVCGEDASYTIRKEEFCDSNLIQVGGDDMYEARCLKHHSNIDI
jgi:thymidine kinase